MNKFKKILFVFCIALSSQVTPYVLPPVAIDDEGQEFAELANVIQSDKESKKIVEMYFGKQLELYEAKKRYRMNASCMMGDYFKSIYAVEYYPPVLLEGDITIYEDAYRKGIILCGGTRVYYLPNPFGAGHGEVVDYWK